MFTTERTRAEFLIGAWLIDLIVPPDLGGSLLGNLQPQMLREADVLNAGRRRNAILEPRRSAKTTGLWCVLLGRCYMRPVYMAGYSMMTTAKKTTERFRLDLVGPIERAWPNPKTRPVKLINSNGFERIEFHNGSVLAILSPEGDAIRSGAYDLLVLDEGGEPEPEKWAIVVSAVVPAFDTRGPNAQLVIAGTGGRYRTGSYFWRVLHMESAGVLRYGVPDDVDPDSLETWEGGVRDITDAIHPGLDGLTNLAIIGENFPDLGAALFAREYLGHFGDEHGTTTLFSASGWQKGMQPGEPPEGITDAALALAIHPHGLWVSIAVAWHVTGPTDLATAAWELDGATVTEPHIGFKLVHHQRDMEGIEEILLSFARRLNAPIVYDHGASQTRAAIERLSARAYPRPEFTPYQFSDAKVAAAQLVAAIEAGTVWHWAQAPIEKAAAIAVRRSVGQGFLIGLPKGDDGADVTPLEAVALALDALPDRPIQSLTPADAIQWND
ncbi:hypothetical protein [Microbacterium rhizomatis]|uniref:Terminase n=1 Tax=Microbacterium rhizomatis TaxID=1631477 RepID=A0A5J5IWF4_9MICO|nr:hypothetical protein [Microbacterium rhizomatis]KAA9105013.1 hypothetical protein F6B43_18365 [Microbacterium rhizomatis]